MLRPRHYDLEIWQDAMRLVRETYGVTGKLPSDERFGLVTQMRRCAVSIPSNIAEGAARGSKAELVRFLMIARGSLLELDTQLRICEDLGFLDDHKSLQHRIERLFGKLNAFIALKRKGSGSPQRIPENGAR